uniref:RGS domain-containing protein n=1 Tax=Plectus sambesii TaxID=2011161 RepID=A0A914VN64_9BILA
MRGNLSRKRDAAAAAATSTDDSSPVTPAASNSLTAPRNLPSAPIVRPPIRPFTAASQVIPSLDREMSGTREAPLPPTTDGIDYDQASKWASIPLLDVLADEKGRQLFRCFLHQALAEENLSFYEAVEELKKMTDPAERKNQCAEILELFAPYLNISANAMQKIQKTAQSDNPDPAAFVQATKEVFRLLDSDQFPRFRRSELYLQYLEDLLPRSEAEKWTVSFESLLANQVGRYRFRQFLRHIHAEENLRFWEAVSEFRATKNKSAAMANMGKQIQRQYLIEGSSNEVFLPFAVRQSVEQQLSGDKTVDRTLFDEAIKHVEQVLRNDPYVRFLQSPEYLELFDKK